MSFMHVQDAIGIFCNSLMLFNCVTLKTLLLKLEHYGVGKTALNLVKSCLNDTQTTTLNMKGTLDSILVSFLFLGLPNILTK